MKYFFFDIDGTLAVGLTKTVPESTKKCLKLLKDNGNFVAIATGRLQRDAEMFGSKIGINSFVSDGGNSITINGSIINMESLPKNECIEFLKHLDNIGIPWAVTVENELVRITKDLRFTKFVNDKYFITKVVNDIDIHECDNIYKISVACNSEQEKYINFGKLPVVHFTKECLFIEPNNKEKGIKKIIEKLNAKNEDVVVFGDGENDTTMFSREWFSIAMGNAVSELKMKADYITEDCDKDGIMNACIKFGWV